MLQLLRWATRSVTRVGRKSHGRASSCRTRSAQHRRRGDLVVEDHLWVAASRLTQPEPNGCPRVELVLLGLGAPASGQFQTVRKQRGVLHKQWLAAHEDGRLPSRSSMLPRKARLWHPSWTPITCELPSGISSMIVVPPLSACRRRLTSRVKAVTESSLSVFS